MTSNNKKHIKASITAVGGYLPEDSISNKDLEAMVDTSDEWIKALEPIGTNANKPHLEIAPWLIIIFAERFGTFDDGSKYKNYYVPESVGIATGFLIAALHKAGLSVLTHTPNPMSFLNDLCNRPKSNKPVMILTVGHASEDATVPKVAKIKKDIKEILTVLD